MRLHACVALLLLSLSTTASAQLIGCDRRLGWTIDGEHCPRCNIVLTGSIAKKQSFGVCIQCQSGCPYDKAAPDSPDDPSQGEILAPSQFNVCGLLTPSPKVLVSAQQMPVVLRVDATSIDEMSRRYPIAATFVALMASREGAPNIFDAGTVTVGLRHQPRAETASAFLGRGDEAMQAPFVIELPLFEQVVVEVRGERLLSGDIEWWVLSSHESKQGMRVLEGPVRIVLTDSGDRAAASLGNMGVVAPVMSVAAVE